MGIERRERGIGFLGRYRSQWRNPQPAEAELHVFQRVRFRLSLDLGQSTGKAGASFSQPGTGRIRCRDRQGASRAHGGEYRSGNELLLDGTISPTSLDPHVASAKPVAKLDQNAQFIDPAIRNVGADPPTPSLPDEADRRGGGYLSEAAEMPDRSSSCQHEAGEWHRAVGVVPRPVLG